MNHILSLPLHLELGKQRKRYYLNMNNYRNWHYHVSDALKKLYKEAVWNELIYLKIQNIKFQSFTLDFTLFRGDKRRVDRSNILSIHEKFFCDALTGLNIIEDDNDHFLKKTTYQTGEIDRLNPRVEIRINNL